MVLWMHGGVMKCKEDILVARLKIPHPYLCGLGMGRFVLFPAKLATAPPTRMYYHKHKERQEIVNSLATHNSSQLCWLELFTWLFNIRWKWLWTQT